jgi:hypothetical protein
MIQGCKHSKEEEEEEDQPQQRFAVLSEQEQSCAAVESARAHPNQRHIERKNVMWRKRWSSNHRHFAPFPFAARKKST